MAKKKHRKKHPNRPSKTLKREARLMKARQWLPTYEGTRVVRAYRKRFCVDVNSAVRDLMEIGYEFKPGYVDSLLKSEAIRQEQQRIKKEERRQLEYEMLEQDDTFFFIAGYTSGGAPYGVTWDDMARESRRQARKQLPPIPVLFSELDDRQKAEAHSRLEELIGDYLCDADYLPTDKDREKILDGLCDELSESLDEWAIEPFDPSDLYGLVEDEDEDEDEDSDDDEHIEVEPFKEIIPDNELITAFDKIVSSYNEELKAEGIGLPSFLDSLLVVETDRLKIRRFHGGDLSPLLAIMKKREVMYAWEAGFSKNETRKWLNRQLSCYHKDRYGYFAVILKDSGKLIGQAGLIKSVLNGENIVELGYILDNTAWGHGYALEAARACVEIAFTEFRLEKLYVIVLPENVTSVRVAEKLGMRKSGEYIKSYKDKEMPHDIYILDKSVK